MYKIGIVGRGFVGAAVEYGFSAQTGCDAEIKVYDKEETKSTHTLEKTMTSDFIFVSVPTPANTDGSINLDIIYECFEEMNRVNKSKTNVILLRSTVTPGTTRKLKNKFRNLNIVFNPEFLTERSAKFDFINQARVILGGKKTDTDKVEDMYKWRFGNSLPVVKTNYETAELIKYMCNCYFATKVSFLNEMYHIADACGVDWDTAVDGFVRDGRIGHSHLSVPGPDGKFGFGGSCFPKDLRAIIHLSKQLGISPNVMRGAWETNLDVRPERDWEKLKGRAVVEE